MEEISVLTMHDKDIKPTIIVYEDCFILLNIKCIRLFKALVELIVLKEMPFLFNPSVLLLINIVYHDPTIVYLSVVKRIFIHFSASICVCV